VNKMRQNRASLHHQVSGVRHKAYLPQIGERPDSLGRSTPGSVHALEGTPGSAWAPESSPHFVSSQSSPSARSAAGPDAGTRGDSSTSIVQHRHAVQHGTCDSMRTANLLATSGKGQRGTAESPTGSSAH
jgi:hypothetical protein